MLTPGWPPPREGNKPPWSVPAKAHYGTSYEGPRAAAHFGRPETRFPEDIMAVGHTILVQSHPRLSFIYPVSPLRV